METWEQFVEALSQLGSDEPVIKGAVLLATGSYTSWAIGRSLWRWVRGKVAAASSREKRIKMDIDAPEGTWLDIKVNIAEDGDKAI